VNLDDIRKLADGQIHNQERTNDYVKFHLLQSENHLPTSHLKELSDLLTSHDVFWSDMNETEFAENVVSRLKNNLVQRATDSESPLVRTTEKRNQRIIPSDWIYQLEVIDKDEQIFDFLEWIEHLRLRESPQEDDVSSNPSGVVLIAKPGHGKTCWLAQSAVNLWNSQWKSDVDTSSGSLFRKIKHLPVILDLRKIGRYLDEESSARIFYEDTQQIIWSDLHSYEKSKLRQVLGSTLRAVISGSDSRSLIESFTRELEYTMPFVILFDGWDELQETCRKDMLKYLEFLLEYEIPVVVTSRDIDPSLMKLIPYQIELSLPSSEDIREYTTITEVSISTRHLEEIRQWLGEITPLDLQILTSVPNLKDLPHKRAALYRNWLIFHSLREILPDKNFHSITNTEELDSYLNETRVGIDNILLRDIIGSIGNQYGDDEYSIMKYVPRIAYLEVLGRNHTLDYDAAVRKNKYLRAFIDWKKGSAQTRVPQIRRKHMLHYLASEFIFSEYLQHQNWSIQGKTLLAPLLREILEYDSRRIKGHEQLSADSVTIAIIMDAEAERIEHQVPERIYNKQTSAWYESLFLTFVDYWKEAKQNNDRKIQYWIIVSVLYLLDQNIFSFSTSRYEPYDFLSVIYLIENRQGDIASMPKLQQSKLENNHLLVDPSGWDIGYISQESIDSMLRELVVIRPKLLPWIVRVTSASTHPVIRHALERGLSDRFIYYTFEHVIIDEPSNEPELWFDLLLRMIFKHQSPLLVTLLPDILPSLTEISDTNLEQIIGIFSWTKPQIDTKYNLIKQSKTLKLNRRQNERIKQILHDSMAPLRYLFVALAAVHNVPNIEMNEYFLAIECLEDYKTQSLVVSRILQEDRNECLKLFLTLPRETIQDFESYLVKPVGYFGFESGEFSRYEVEYLSKEYAELLHDYCEIWWSHNLQSLDDGFKLLDEIIEEDSLDKGFKTISYRNKETFGRIVTMAESAGSDALRELIMKCYDAGIDAKICPIAKEKLSDALKKIGNSDSKLISFLIKIYETRSHLLLGIWTAETWLKYVKQFPLESVVIWDEVFEYYVDAGGLSSLDDAMKAIAYASVESSFWDIKCGLLKWLHTRSDGEKEDLIIKSLQSGIQIGHFHEILDTLHSISERTPKLESYLFSIAKNNPPSFYNIDPRRWPTENDVGLHAYVHLSDSAKRRIVKSQVLKVLNRDNSLDEIYHKDAVKEYFTLADPEDLDILGKILDKSPYYFNAVIDINSEKLESIGDHLTNPFSKTYHEMAMKGLEDYVAELKSEKAEKIIDLIVRNKHDFIFGFDTLTRKMATLRPDLKNLLLNRIEEMPIEWDSEYAVIWISDLISTHNSKIPDFITRIIDNWNNEQLLFWTDYFRSKDTDVFSKLTELVNKMEKENSIMVILFTLLELCQKNNTTKQQVWDLQAFQKLDLEKKRDLKSGTWNPRTLYHPIRFVKF
jgi:hypothetical protein